MGHFCLETPQIVKNKKLIPIHIERNHIVIGQTIKKKSYICILKQHKICNCGFIHETD